MKTKKKMKIVWFARGGGIAQCGPYKSQVEATNAIRATSRRNLFPDNVFVWPEEVEA